MDGSRFDRFVSALAAGTTRRHAFRAAAAGAFAGLLGHAATTEVAAACVRPGKKGCAGPQRRGCCKDATCRGGTKTKEGTCVCKGSLTPCGATCVHPKSDRNNCGRCNKRCAPGHSCKAGKCTSMLGCQAGNHLCSGQQPNCPGTSNRNCFCTTDVHGIPRCADESTSFCMNCTRNTDCGPGRMCFRANFGICSCDDPGENGNACMVATCDGSS